MHFRRGGEHSRDTRLLKGTKKQDKYKLLIRFQLEVISLENVQWLNVPKGVIRYCLQTIIYTKFARVSYDLNFHVSTLFAFYERILNNQIQVWYLKMQSKMHLILRYNGVKRSRAFSSAPKDTQTAFNLQKRLITIIYCWPLK